MPDENESRTDEAKEFEVLEEDSSEIDHKIQAFEQRTETNTKPVQESADMALIQSAINKNYTIEQIEKLMDLRDREEGRIAKKAFFIDFAAFKQENVRVITDKINDMFDGRRYPSVGNFLNTVNPYLGKHNLSANFIIDDKAERIKVTCTIYHIDGHILESGMSAKPDTKGPQGAAVKTEIHGALSTVTHLMRATFSAATGIAAIDPEFDDDGNLAGAGAYISEDQAKKLNALMEETKINKTVFLKSLKVEEIEKLPLMKFKKALSTLEAKKKKAK